MELDLTTRGTTRRHQLTVSCKPPNVSQVGAATYLNDDSMDKSNTSQIGSTASSNDSMDKGSTNDGSTPLCTDYPIAASGHGYVLGGLAASQKDSNQYSTNTDSVEPNAASETEHDPDSMEPTP